MTGSLLTWCDIHQLDVSIKNQLRNGIVAPEGLES